MIDLVRPRPVEEPTGTLQQTPSDNQLAESSSDMVHKRPSESTGASQGSSKRLREQSERHGEHLSKTTGHGLGGEDQPAPRSQQVARFRDLENTHHRLSEAHKVVVTKLRETHATCQKQEQEINLLRERLRESSTLLDVRNRELKVAKTFLSKEDPFSTSDIVQSIRDLNSEIMQIATHLAENLALKRLRSLPAGNIPEGPCKPIFTSLILPRGLWDEVDEGSLELALQGYLVVWVYLIVNAWGFGEASGWCDQLYSKVCETGTLMCYFLVISYVTHSTTEDSTVASNWRALTRRTLFNVDSTRSDLPRQIVNGAIEELASLLSFCGAGVFAENTRNIHKHAGEKLESLFLAARKLNKMVGENVVSGDLMVVMITGGHLFDADYMDDAYARSGAKPGRHAVICTTNLGLCERKGAKVENMLLKPKVVLGDL